MTKRDFQLIADAVADELYHARFRPDFAQAQYTIKGVCEHLAVRLGEVNPRFDHARFMKACGFGEG